MEELLQFFKDNGVSIQITLLPKEKPTVHAYDHNYFDMLVKTEGETLVEALENMKYKLFG